MDAVVTGDSTVGSLCFNGAIRGHEYGGHQAEGAISLGDDVRLNIPIVVFASPDETSIALDGVCNKIIYQTVLVPDLLGFEFFFLGALVDFFEDVFEAAIVPLQYGVFGAQVQRIVALDGILERGMSEFIDGLVSVVHAQHDAGA